MKEIEIVIEKKREELYSAAEKFGLQHPLVIQKSHELDVLINLLFEKYSCVK
ncbi:aspartyl-phosphate phosphatase Spo0E family protein [Cytobacillus firmus]|uniref:aspartyl-phosphate phosphatase Spo0E family protein n=1 Tax=Cytobacillus firmus TaxID=1399 RepID=UPI0030034DB0